jgi:hypothetical protein
MVQTLTAPVARPFVSMFARCAYCPGMTSFRCLNCQTPICPDCVPSDYCPECRPAPVTPLMGWSMVNDGNVADDATFYAVTCAGCGDTFQSEEPDDDMCAACADPVLAAELRAMRPASVTRPADCAFCGNPMFGRDTDGTRHPRCARFLSGLDARKESPIAA